MLDESLIFSINRGRCLAFVGAGPSCEIGYPSWSQLAQNTYEYLKTQQLVTDARAYEKYLETKQYPEMFRQAERNAGGREELIKIVGPLFPTKVDGRGPIYEMLARWPFACYLTTNYDNELSRYLEAIGVHFTTVGNRVEDFYNIRDNMSHLIFKLHSDFKYPKEIVLTSSDYHSFFTGSERQYFRDKLRFVMESFDIFIVGYSLSDKNIGLILETAKNTASPIHPIYMTVADCTHAEEQELFEKYNIRATSYDNTSGNHSQLRRILSTADKFIVPRRERTDIPLIPPSSELPDAAASLLIFRRLQEIRYSDEITSTEYIGPLVLQALSGAPNQRLSVSDILSLPPLNKIAQNNRQDMLFTVGQVVVALEKDGYISQIDGAYFISASGLEAVGKTNAIRKAEEEQAYGQFIIDIKSQYANLDVNQEQLAHSSLRDAIVSGYQKRGLAIANTIFIQQNMEPDDFSAMFKAVTSAAQVFSGDKELQASFVDAARKFLVQPTSPQRSYLMSLSQGYFLYHMIGLDPTCAKIRREMFRNTAWLCDSSVLLPLFALGSHNHEYATDLFTRLSSLDAAVFTTNNLLQEAWEHLEWAKRLIGSSETNPSSFYHAALVKGSYKQNLFIDGYIRLAAEGLIADFQEYLELSCPFGCSREELAEQLSTWNITLIKMSQLNGFVQEDWGAVQETQEKIQRERELRATFRSELQTKAEAEVVHIIEGLRSGRYSFDNVESSMQTYYFVSLSLILDQISKRTGVITWRPEALYRYVTALPGEKIDPELLQQAMLYEYFYAGVVFIDEHRYRKFFGPAINQSRAAFPEQIEKLRKQTETIYVPDYDEAFEKTPDLEKPFFTLQIERRYVEQIERKKQQAEQRAVRLELDLGKTTRKLDAVLGIKAERHADHEARRRRNLLDPKRMKKLQRREKRKKQKKGKK